MIEKVTGVANTHLGGHSTKRVFLLSATLAASSLFSMTSVLADDGGLYTLDDALAEIQAIDRAGTSANADSMALVAKNQLRDRILPDHQKLNEPLLQSAHAALVSENASFFTPGAIDGRVEAIAIDGDTVFVGGTFTKIQMALDGEMSVQPQRSGQAG